MVRSITLAGALTDMLLTDVQTPPGSAGALDGAIQLASSAPELLDLVAFCVARMPPRAQAVAAQRLAARVGEQGHGSQRPAARSTRSRRA